MSTRTIRVAVVGAGRRGQAHLKAIAAYHQAELVGVCDVVSPAAAAASAQFGGRPYTDSVELLDKERPDVIFVVTPPQFHAQPAIAAAARGIHIFLEKPVAFDLPEAARIAEAVERAGILCTVGYQWRHTAAAQRAKAIIGTQPVAVVRLVYYHTIPLVESLRDKQQSGGQVVEQITHLVDLSRFLVGEIDEVSAYYTLQTRPPEEFHNWDGYAVAMRYAGGAVGTITGTYALFLGHGQPPALDIVLREQLLRIEGGRLTIRKPGTEPELVSGEQNITHAFLDAVVAGGDPGGKILSPIGDALRTHAVTLACNAAAEYGRPVGVEAFIRSQLG